MRNVPAMTATSWMAKVLTTGMGETTCDYLVHRLSPLSPSFSAQSVSSPP
jgi:uncharacterized membrane-anchored protein